MKNSTGLMAPKITANFGNFRGSKTGHCQMYIWIEHPPVLQIKTTDTTIFLNSSNEAQTKEWYNQLNDAISSNK